jgi:molecular chaperone DnaJ
MKTANAKDYYAILGVPSDADQQAIKRAFRDLARRFHPDHSTEPDAQERFKEIAEAYAILSDPDKRADYDHSGAAGVAVEDFATNLNLGDLLGDLFGDRGTSGNTKGPGWFGRLFGEPGWSDLTRGPVRGADVKLTLTVPLATILTGGTETVVIRRPGLCPTCEGSGAAPGSRPRDCRRCQGSGQVVTERRQRTTMLRHVTDCPVCRGSGAMIDDPCPDCGGAGEAEQDERVTMRIPRGLGEGTTLRLPERGGPAPAGGIDGDVYVTVHTAADSRFTRRGADLWHEAQISVPDAVLGTSLAVPSLEGEIPLAVPPGTQPGTVLRIPGQGLPYPDKQGRGDLTVKVAIRIPEHLGKQEQHLYQQLQRIADKK